MNSFPLDDIKVISLEQAVAAPFASRQLAELGARVIKVERPEVGDFARNYDDTVQGLSANFVWLNHQVSNGKPLINHISFNIFINNFNIFFKF